MTQALLLAVWVICLVLCCLSSSAKGSNSSSQMTHSLDICSRVGLRHMRSMCHEDADLVLPLNFEFALYRREHVHSPRRPARSSAELGHLNWRKRSVAESKHSMCQCLWVIEGSQLST
jgi:hypothetical protein